MKQIVKNSIKLSGYLLGILFFLLLMQSSVSAAIYYVATNGNNSNPGTLSQPWLTIQYAADNVAPGDIVYIRAGTYSKWKVNVSGASGNIITFRNYPGELPVINGNWTSGPGVEIRGVSYITIDGIRFYQISGNGVHIEGSTSGVATPVYNIIIRNCQVDGTSNAGIYVCGLIMGSNIGVNEYRTFNITIENNDITNTNYPSGGNECISLGGGTDGFIIRNNYVHDSEQYGIDAKFGAINGQIYGNTIHNMEKHGIYIDCNSRTCANIDIYDNFIYNCGSNGICITRESRRTPVEPNIRNIRVFDNVATGCRRGFLAYVINSVDPYTGDFKNVEVVNNTFHDNNADTFDPQSIKIIDISKITNHGGWKVANNLTSLNDAPLITNSSGADWVTTPNVHSSTSAPYVNAANRDFHLVSGSIAEGAANATYLCKSTDHDGVSRGTPPDCGAFEYVGTVTIPNAPSFLNAAEVSSSQIDLSWTDNSSNEDGFKIERKTGVDSYSQIAQVGANVTSYSNTGLNASTTYTYRVRAYNTAGNSTYSNEASATTQSGGGGLPSPWVNADIGAVGAAGSASYSSDVFTVDGSGADVWGEADEFHYVYQQVSGDAEIISRVPSQENVHDWAKSGVMIRETLAAGSKNAFMFITPGYGFRFQSRDATDGTSVSTDGGSINTAPNNWVRLVRSGNSITAYKSSDGTSWTQVGTAVTISMTTSVYVGLAVTSHNNGVSCTTTFDNVQVIGGATIPNAPSSLSAAAVSSSQINLTWTDNSSNENGFKIERKTGTGSYSQIDQVGANATSYSNTGLSASTIYTYRVFAYNTAGNSSYSNESGDTTQSVSLPSPWVNADIGAVGAAGSASHSSGVFTVDGSGADVWGAADEFHYVYQQVSGDVEIISRVPSQEDVHIWSKSGVMIRETLAAGSKNAFMFITPNYGFRFQSRDATDGTTVSTDGGTITTAPNNWVRLVRSGNNITAYKSSDGTSWTQVGTAVTISMTSSVYVGMVVCSHYDGVLCTTTFDNVQVSTATIPNAPSSLSAAAVSSSQINLSWTDNSSNEDGFKIERKMGAGSFSQIDQVGANTTSYSDTVLSALTFYTYRVMAYNSAGNSSHSNEASDTTDGVSALFSDDFEDGNDSGWTQESGSWSVVTDNGSKRYEQNTYSTSEYRTSVGETSWGDYSFEVDVQPLSFDGNSAVFINFRYTDNSDTYRVVVHGYNQLRLQKKVSGALTELANISYTFNPSTVYTIRIEANGTNLKVYINDNLEISTTDASHSSGKIALATWKTTANFDNVLVQEITTKSITIATSQETIKQLNGYSVVCYPNPFNTSSRIRFRIPPRVKKSKVVLTVNDLFGRQLYMLVNDFVDSGDHEIEFNASGLPNGTYIFCLKHGDSVVTNRTIKIQ